MSYRDYQTNLAPGWLQGPNGAVWEGELGGAKDDMLDRARLGVLARMPGKVVREQGTQPVEAPTDALDRTAADRMMPRGSGELDPALAARLEAAWDATWPYAGSPYGLLTALTTLGYSSPNIVQDNGRYWYLSGGNVAYGNLMTMATRGRPGWMFDFRDDLWNRFALLFPSDASDLSSADGQRILNATAEIWRPGNCTFVGTFVILAGRVWGWPTTQTWGDGDNWGGSSVRFIPPDGSAPVVTGP